MKLLANTSRTVLFLLLLLSLSSCASKKAYKDGMKYEENQMYIEAVNAYLMALEKKPEYVDARIALMRSSARLSVFLEEKIESAYQRKADQEVVEYYTLFTKLKSATEPYNIEIVINERSHGQFNESKNRYLHDNYDKANQAIATQNFTQAVKLLTDILTVDNNFKDCKELLLFAQCEPFYLQATNAIHNGKYRTAYNYLAKALKIDPNFKDAAQLQTDAVSQGMRLIAFDNIKNCSENAYFCQQLKQSTIQLVNKSNDPFLKMVELAEHKQLIEVQKELMKNGNQIASQNLVPVNTIVTANIQVTSKTTPLKNKKCKGYLRQEDKNKNVTYKKVYYYEYSRSRSVSVNIPYVIITTPAGEKLMSATLTPSAQDEIFYIYYDGKNDKNLVLGHWEDTGKFNPERDVVYSDAMSLSKVKNLVNARKELESTQQMQNKLVQEVAKSLSRAIIATSPKE